MKNIIYAFIFCMSIAFVGAQEQMQQMDVENEKSEIVFIGSLIKNRPLGLMNPSEYCLEDGYIYKGADYRIGTTNIHAANPQDLSSFEGKTVIIYGSMVRDLTQILVKMQKAPDNYGLEQSSQQLRSDWVTEETGFSIGQSTRERLKKFSFLRYTKIEEFTGLNIKKDETTVKVKFTNNLGQKIEHLEIMAHYESVRGKPVARYMVNEINSLHNEQTISLTFPIIFPEEDSRKAKFQSIRIACSQDNLVIDIGK